MYLDYLLLGTCSRFFCFFFFNSTSNCILIVLNWSKFSEWWMLDVLFLAFIIVSSGVGEITFKWVVNANINLFLFCFLTTGIDVEKFDSWFLWCYFETLFRVLYQRRIDSLVLKWVCWEFELFAEFNLFKRTLLLFNDENEAWLKCSRVSWKVMFFSHGN